MTWRKTQKQLQSLVPKTKNPAERFLRDFWYLVFGILTFEF